MSNLSSKIDLLFWNDGRKVPHKPKHFLQASAYLKSSNQEIWIIEHCRGRYYTEIIDNDDLFLTQKTLVYFEDMSDLVYYDLTWS